MVSLRSTSGGVGDDVRFSHVFRNARFDRLDVARPEAGGGPLVLGPGEARADGTLQGRDGSANGGLPLPRGGGSSSGSHGFGAGSEGSNKDKTTARVEDIGKQNGNGE